MSEDAQSVSRSERWDSALDDSDLRELAEKAWGMDAQKNKAAEELSELAACLNRDLNGQQDWQEFVEELVDARIMLWQMERWVRDDHLEAELRDSLRSLRARLPEGVDDAE